MKWYLILAKDRISMTLLSIFRDITQWVTKICQYNLNFFFAFKSLKCEM